MSEWITDRRPTREDADCLGLVWVSQDDGTVLQNWSYVDKGIAWMPTNRPEPYVKPKRYTAQWYKDAGCWAIFEGDYIALRMFQFDIESDDGYREAAEEIAAIYERTMS